MKKILLTFTAMGLVLAQSYGIQFFEYDDQREVISVDSLGSSFDWEAMDQYSPNFMGIMYPPSDLNPEEIDFDAEPLPVFILNSAEHMVDGNYSIDVELVSDGLGNDTENTILVPVGVFSTYKGAPRVFRVTAEQAPEFESKDVLIEYGLLLGQGKGEAYIEYWYRTDSTGQWQKLTDFDTNEYGATNEGFTPNSGFKYTRWLAGQQLGNTVKTNNAQIRVTAKYGAASGWDGYDPFHQETYESPTGGYDSPTGGTGDDPYSTDSDGDGVMDAYDYAPYDPTIQNDPNVYSSGDGGYQSPTGN